MSNNNDNFKTKVIGKLKYFPKTNITREQEGKVRSVLYKLPYIATCTKCKSVILIGRECKIGMTIPCRGKINSLVILCPECKEKYDNAKYIAEINWTRFAMVMRNPDKYFDYMEDQYGKIDMDLYESNIKNLIDYHNDLLDSDENSKYDAKVDDIYHMIIKSSKVSEDDSFKKLYTINPSLISSSKYNEFTLIIRSLPWITFCDKCHSVIRFDGSNNIRFYDKIHGYGLKCKICDKNNTDDEDDTIIKLDNRYMPIGERCKCGFLPKGALIGKCPRCNTFSFDYLNYRIDKEYGNIDMDHVEKIVDSLVDYLYDKNVVSFYNESLKDNDIRNSLNIKDCVGSLTVDKDRLADIGKADDQMMLYAATHKDRSRSVSLKNFKGNEKLDYTTNQYTNDDNTHEETSMNKSNKIEYISESIMRGRYRIEYCLNPSGKFKVIDTTSRMIKVMLDMKEILYIAGNVVKYENIKKVHEYEAEDINKYHNMHPYCILGLDSPIKDSDKCENKDSRAVGFKNLIVPDINHYTEAYIINYSCTIDGKFNIVDVITKDYIVGFNMKDILYIASQVVKAYRINELHKAANDSIRSLKERNPYAILGIEDLIENTDKED